MTSTFVGRIRVTLIIEKPFYVGSTTTFISHGIFVGIIFILNKKILKKYKVHLRGEDEGGGGGGEILAGRCRLKMMMINFFIAVTKNNDNVNYDYD